MSDARMSGTAYGTIVLHIAPEAAVGGPIGLVRNGDRIRLSVKNGSSTCWSTRRSWPSAAQAATRKAGRHARGSGYDKLFRERVMQAPDGCDFDFCR